MRKSEFICHEAHARWYRTKKLPSLPVVYGRGYAFIGDVFLQGQDLVDGVWERCCRKHTGDAVAALKQQIPSLNGLWALVVLWPGGRVLAATDRIRSIPLFYAQGPDQLLLSSSVDALLERLGPAPISEHAAFEYLMSGHVTGSDTLYEGIRQIEGGGMLEYDPAAPHAGVKTHRYFQYLRGDFFAATEEELERELEERLNSTFARFADAFGGGRIVVPLSGGLDSRLLVSMLKRHGAKDVLCYTYGVPDNYESRLSREIAAALGYEWEYVEYNQEVWIRWLQDGRLQRYWDHAIRGTSLPHFQSLPALMSLIERGKVHDATVMPGHVWGLFTGGDVPPELCAAESDDDLAAARNAILRHRFPLWPDVEKIALHLRWPIERIEAQISPPSVPAGCPALALYELWHIDNFMGRFIVNSVRMSEFAGQSWALPYWDHELTDFYRRVPLEYRWRQRLFVNTLNDRILRGDLEPIRHIPRNTGQLITDRVAEPVPATPPAQPRRSPFEAGLRELLKSTGLMRFARRMKYRSRPFQSFGFECWFTEGRDPRRVTVAQALRKHAVKENLPPELWKLIEPHASQLLIQCNYNGVLSAVTLAREYEKHQ